ncbi:MAG TPA: SDR family NAD(P)-dependent oxidoreductase, partial [Rhodanobacteraceae bacterium]|nr:SDR family NAD(P)-dependent oxidoreductase [Rhodanobacteraceae bacterium]
MRLIGSTRAALARLILASSLVAAPAIAGAETVLITGANSGLGLEFAKQYAAKDWTVIATHRRREMPGTLAELVAKYPKVRVETLDVTDLEQAKALAAKLTDVPIDILVNNAGVYNDRSGCASGDDACPGSYQTQSFGQLDFALLDTITAVNIKGPLIVSQTF